MPRRLSPSPAGTAGSPATGVLDRRGSARATVAGVRRRAVGRDVPVATGATHAAAGVVPRMRRPRGASGSATAQETAARVPRGRGTALDQRIEHHLARLQDTTLPTRPGTIDDDRARRDPDTTSFAAVRPDGTGPRTGPSQPARVTTAADRPRTTEFPAVLSFD